MSPRHFSPRPYFSFWAQSLNSQQIQSSIYPRWGFKHHIPAVPLHFLYHAVLRTLNNMTQGQTYFSPSRISDFHEAHGNSAARHQKRLKLKSLAAHASYRASPPPESRADASTGLHHHSSKPPCQEMRTDLSGRGYRLPDGGLRHGQ